MGNSKKKLWVFTDTKNSKFERRFDCSEYGLWEYQRMLLTDRKYTIPVLSKCVFDSNLTHEYFLEAIKKTHFADNGFSVQILGNSSNHTF